MKSFTGVTRYYYENKETHCLTFFQNKNIRRMIYYENGKEHRIGGPAVIEYYEDGNIEYELYCENDKKHRIGGPAKISYYEDGIISYNYYQNNVFFNPRGSTQLGLNRNHFLIYKVYKTQTNKKFNVKGPAYIICFQFEWNIYKYLDTFDPTIF